MDNTAIKVIKRSTEGSLQGTLSFAEVVGMLIQVGVSRYHVDYPRSEKTVYFRNGESFVESLLLPEPPIAEAFSTAEVAAAVRASQTEGQSFTDFVSRTRKAGCVGYVAYLDGRRVVYTGALGEEHVEYFPS